MVVTQPAAVHPPPQASGPNAPRPVRAVSRPLSGRSLVTAWAISISLHIALLALMFHLAWYGAASRDEDALPVALTDLLGDVEGTKTSLGTAPNFSESIERPETEAIEPQKTEEVSAASGVEQMTGESRGDLDIIGIGTGGADFGGLGGAGGEGPVFFQAGGGKARGVKRVVYVVDRSGSMFDTFELVQQELKSSISKLQMTQKFHVIFFNAGEPLENPPKRLISARPAQKQEFFEFLDTVRPEGSTNPSRAMQRAFQCEPEIIFFLTDGEFERSLLGHLREWNRERRVRIFTLAYMNPAGSELLETIAREHGGEFRFVSDRDMP